VRRMGRTKATKSSSATRCDGRLRKSFGMGHELRHIQVIRRRMYRPPRCTDHSEGNEIRGLTTSMTQQPAVLYAGAMVRPCAGSTRTPRYSGEGRLPRQISCHAGSRGEDEHSRTWTSRLPRQIRAYLVICCDLCPLVPTAVSVVPIRGIVTFS